MTIHIADTNRIIQVLDSDTGLQSNNTFDKRAGCTSRQWTYEQYQLVQHGAWWSEWKRTSGYGYCAKDPGQSNSLNFEVAWTTGYGIAIDAGISIETSIGLMAGVGVSVEKSISTSQGMSCSCQGNEETCVWEQSKLTWSDTQKQKCYRFANCDGEIVNCDAWSKYQRTNAPIKNDFTAFNFGCSTDSAC